MKTVEEVLKLIDIKKKLYDQLLKEWDEMDPTSLSKTEHAKALKRMIEIQEAEIELLNWILN